MLWLIQRDFLEGKTVQSMVSEALQPVPNPFQDQDIAQVTPATLIHAVSYGSFVQCLHMCMLCALIHAYHASTKQLLLERAHVFEPEPLYVYWRAKRRTEPG